MKNVGSRGIDWWNVMCNSSRNIGIAGALPKTAVLKQQVINGGRMLEARNFPSSS